MSAHHLVLLECNNVGQILLSFFCCSYLQLLKKGFKEGIRNCLLSEGLILVATEKRTPTSIKRVLLMNRQFDSDFFLLPFTDINRLIESKIINSDGIFRVIQFYFLYLLKKLKNNSWIKHRISC